MKTKTAKWFLITLLLGCSFASNLGAQTSKRIKSHSWAEELIKEVVTDIKASPEGSVYLAAVDPDKLSFSHELADGDAKGSIVRWQIKNDLKWVRGKTQAEPYQIGTVEFGYKPVVVSTTGISLEVYVAFKEGDSLVSRDRSFVIRNNPRIMMGYSVITDRKTKALQTRIGQIMQEDIRKLPTTSIRN